MTEQLDTATDASNNFDEDVLDRAEESKAEAFKRVTNFRLGKTTKRLRQFHALANRGSYEYTEEQVNYIINALNEEVHEIHKAFLGEKDEPAVPQL